MADEIVVDVGHPDDIVAARQAVHKLARDLGFSLTDVTMIATAISEIARNITSYAGSGTIRLAVQDRDGRTALVVRAEDEGPGSPTSTGRSRTAIRPAAG
ncbi:serine/threonine-protein kinase rsbT [Mycobacterium xenopi 3993]|nr:serine/threonine-protein kinase rsbT [Mycobacterium xenopi 3993]